MNLTNKHSILISIVTVLLFFLIVWIAVDIDDKIKDSENTISVSATGEVYSAPDLALTSFSVVTEAETTVEALAENTAKMNAVIDFIKSEAVADKDIKTTGFNIYPRYEWCDGSSSIKPCPINKRTLIGYEVNQTLQVKIRDMEKIGLIIQGATNKGANQMSGLTFTIDDEDSLKEEARAKAITKAKAKAKELTSQLDVSLGEVVQFNESGSYPQYYYATEAMDAMGGGDLKIETGENKISVTVNITYKIY